MQIKIVDKKQCIPSNDAKQNDECPRRTRARAVKPSGRRCTARQAMQVGNGSARNKLLYLGSAVLRHIHKLFVNNKNLRISHETETPRHPLQPPPVASPSAALALPSPARAPQIGSFLRACTRQMLKSLMSLLPAHDHLSPPASALCPWLSGLGLMLR